MSDADRLPPEVLAVLDERARKYAARGRDAEGDVLGVLLFSRGPRRYAVPLDRLRSIQRVGHLRALPGAAPTVAGVTYFRGALASAHDLAAFRVPVATPDAPRWVLFCESDGETFGLVADAVQDIAMVPRGEVRPMPEEGGERGGYFLGVLPPETLVLEVDELFAAPGFVRAFPG